MRYAFNTEGALARSDCPVLIAHSPDDEIVPFRHAGALAAVRPTATQRVQLSGSHNHPSLEPGGNGQQALGDFIARHTGITTKR